MSKRASRGEKAMPDHQTPLIATIVAGLMLAYVFGLLAHRLRLQPIVGYLVAGVVVGKPRAQLVAERQLGLAESQVHQLSFGRDRRPRQRGRSRGWAIRALLRFRARDEMSGASRR